LIDDELSQQGKVQPVVILAVLVLAFGRFQNHRKLSQAGIGDDPAEGVRADTALADMGVTVDA